MIDKENAIKALEKAWNYLDVQKRTFESVVMRNNGALDGVHAFDDTLDGIKNAITLLKAQEPVKPVLDIDTWRCGNCGHTLEHQELLGDNVLFHEQYNYCPECGRPVKWND